VRRRWTRRREGRRLDPTDRTEEVGPVVTYLLLGTAIALEVLGTMCLKWADGLSRFVPSAGMVLCYVTAFFLLSQVLARGMPVAVAYAIWSAVGIVAVAVLGAALLGERLGPAQLGGIALIVVGVVALELGTSGRA